MPQPKKGRDPRSPQEKRTGVALARAHRLSGDPAVIATAEAEHRVAYFERRIQQLVAEAPPLGEEQRRRLRELLTPLVEGPTAGGAV